MMKQEFIASFINICNINGNNYRYIFIYSFNTNFEVSFLGAVRNFTIDDSCINCNPFNFIYLYNINEISHSIPFSTITQRYSLIGNIKDNNSNNVISLFILNKDINIINPKEIEISSSLEFICEDYSNFNNSNCTGNTQLINEINNNKIRFIEKCNHDFNKINSTCSFLKYNLKTFNITYNKFDCNPSTNINSEAYTNKIYSEFSSTNINSDIYTNNNSDTYTNNIYSDFSTTNINSDIYTNFNSDIYINNIYSDFSSSNVNSDLYQCYFYYYLME